MIKVYGTYCNSDMTEGRGQMVLDKVFVSRADAFAYINTKVGVMGYKPKGGDWANEPYSGHWEVKDLIVYSTLEEQSEEYQNQLRETALKKLTEEERTVLGL